VNYFLLLALWTLILYFSILFYHFDSCFFINRGSISIQTRGGETPAWWQDKEKGTFVLLLILKNFVGIYVYIICSFQSLTFQKQDITAYLLNLQKEKKQR
jgi:hypothetical protein